MERDQKGRFVRAPEPDPMAVYLVNAQAEKRLHREAEDRRFKNGLLIFLALVLLCIPGAVWTIRHRNDPATVECVDEAPISGMCIRWRNLNTGEVHP